MIDLHLHTNMSDGSDSPLELLQKVEEAGCRVFSVTDHDDLRANAIILDALKSVSIRAKFVTGIEFSSVFEGRNLHLLCYGFDPNNELVKQLVEDGRIGRHGRITAMFKHLQLKHGVVIPEKDKADILSRPIPGKVHIAEVILRMNLVWTRQQIFDRLLNDMESREFKVPAERIIDVMQKVGGLTSVAHPIDIQNEYGLGISELSQMIRSLKDRGLTALEVYHTNHNAQNVLDYARIANECGLLVSGGSDYHGKNKDDIRIGILTAYGLSPEDSELTICGRFL